MSKKTNIINNVIIFAVTLGAMFLTVYFSQKTYIASLGMVILYFLIGAILAGLVNTFCHEFGHILAGKKNDYEFSAVTVWFFKWQKIRGRLNFSLIMMGNEAGYTEMLPKSLETAKKGFKKMTLGGIIVSGVLTVLSVAPLCLTKFIPFELYAIWSVFLPVSVYFFLGSAFPTSSAGVRNDGAVLYGIKKNDSEWRVTESLLKVQAELYDGKSYGEIDKSLYFDLPQLQENSPAFINLLNARYNYYLDVLDYENAKKTNDRLLSLAEDYMPKEWQNVIKADALYNACTFDYNEDLADDLTYEIEKYLNSNNTITNVRIKLAYLLYVRKEFESLEIFIKKAEREIKRCQLKGVAKFEEKLIEKIKLDIEKV